MDEVFKTLTCREGDVYKSLRGVGVPRQSVAEVARRLLVSDGRVRQIYAKCVRKLGHPVRARLIDALPEEDRKAFANHAGACCEIENRGMNGGCVNCGDPCL